MKKLIQIGWLVCALALHASAVEFYVETTGDDLNAGTAEAPFQTLEKAQLAVRATLPTATEPIQVWVGGGTYYLDQALEFGLSDSGSASVPVSYAGVSNETVVISGAIQLSPSWSTHSGNILVAHIGTGLSFDVLFADSEQQVLARYPDYDEETAILNGYASDAISADRVATWSDPTTGLVRALHYKMWGGTSYKITGVESDGDPTLEWVGDNNRDPNMHSTYRMVENIFEELDAPGEWFYNENTGMLYFYPPAGLDAATASFEVASAEELIRVVGDASTKVGYLTFDNFTFTQTRRTLFTREYERPLRSDWGVARAGAIYLDNAENVTISNSTFDHLGGNGVFSSGYNRNHLITENEFTDIGATCVLFVGLIDAVRYPSFWDNDDHKTDIQDLTPGPQTDDYPANCTVSYNHMQDMGRFEKQTCGVNISMSESITVSHNTIHGSPRSGLNVCDGTWGGHLFEFNDVFDCIRETSDHGPFNSWGRDRFWSYLGFNTTGSEGAAKKPYAFLDAWKTTVIRNNRFHYDEPSRFGIDLDDGSTNYEIYNNLMLNCSLKLREGFGRKAYNNIMINQPAELHVWYDECGDIITNNIILSSKAYSVVQVDIEESLATIDYNLFYNAGESVSVAFGGYTDQNSLIADPLFVDTDQNDFTVAANSPAIGLGYVNFPMDQFGKPGAPEPGPVDIVSAEDLAADTEPLMGAEACSIYSEGVQSALGAPDLNGVYLRTVPEGSYAELQGFLSGDVIRSMNGTTITDKQSFWVLYHLVEPGTEIEITRLRDQIESPASFIKTSIAEELNDTAGVIYSSNWSPQEKPDAFNGDLKYNNTVGAYFELTFYGTGIEYTSQINSDMGEVEVYIDGELDKTVSYYNESRVYQQTIYRQRNLTAGVHTLRAVNTETEFMMLDSLTIHTAPYVEERATNPFIKHMFTADPSAHVWADGRLYVYPSTDIAGSSNYRSMDGYHVFSTDDMLNWRDHGEILHSDDVDWSDVSGSMWAPDCVYKDGTYYFYFPHTNNDGEWELGIATSTRPAADFTVQGFVTGGTTYADPCVFIDDDGQAYLYAVVNKKCYGVKLAENMTEIDGEWALQALDDHREGPFVFKRNGIYYLMYPDNASSGHQMRYAIGESPLGPWESKGVFLEKTSSYTSHGSIVEYEGTWYLFYHNADLSGGKATNRSICFDVVTFNEDGTINLVEQTQDPIYQPPVLPVLSNFVYTATGSSTVPVVSSNDLAQTHYLSSSATGGNDVADEHAQLFNGTPGTDSGDTSDIGQVTMDSGNTFTVTLDTSVNTLGYDLTGIDSFFGWSTGSGGRANQGYEITVTYVDGSSAILAEANHWAPNDPATYWTTVSFSAASGDVMASGVESITFDITEDANPGGVVVGREIDIFGVPTVIPVLPGIVYEASGSSTAPTVSSNDLAQTQYLSSSATGGNEVADEHAQLFNGLAGNEIGDTSDAGEVTMDSGNTFTLTLDTSVNTLGYDLTAIDSFFGWSTGAGGRANQGYEITVTYVDDSIAILAEANHWAPNSPASYWTTVSFSETSGSVMATGVKSITFDITEDAIPGGVVVGREIDVFGVPTQGPAAHIPVFEPGVTFSSNQLVLGFSGTVGLHYRVESIDDLMSSNSWQVVTDMISLATSPIDVLVPVTNGASFYRVIWLP